MVASFKRKLKFEKGEDAPFEYSYVMQADLYNKLGQTKVIQEASLRSGIPKGSINAAWDAIGVIKAWATEGHAVAVPGLGSMRFGLRSTSVADVNKVGIGLITCRRVIFTPSVDIKNELKATSISITGIDRDGNIVKRVTSTDDADVEDPDNENVNPDGGGTYTEGSRINISATPKAGYVFDKWSDSVTTANRQMTVNSNLTLTASFKEVTQSGGDDEGGVGEY